MLHQQGDTIGRGGTMPLQASHPPLVLTSYPSLMARRLAAVTCTKSTASLATHNRMMAPNAMVYPQKNFANSCIRLSSWSDPHLGSAAHELM